MTNQLQMCFVLIILAAIASFALSMSMSLTNITIKRKNRIDRNMNNRMKPKIRNEQQQVQQQQQQHVVARQLQDQSVIPYNVELTISLQYLNETVAQLIESLDQSNDIISHLCLTINTQSSGNQVKVAAERNGLSVETRISTSGRPDYECTIVDTNRKYMDDTNKDKWVGGDGYFILRVKVKQVVYVTNNNLQSSSSSVAPPLPSLDIITNIVSAGFNRGLGGRVKFRSLLVTNQWYKSIVNVELLNDETSTSSSPSPSPALLVPITSLPPATITPTSAVSTVMTLSPTSITTTVTTLLPTATTSTTSLPSDVPSETQKMSMKPRRTLSSSSSSAPSVPFAVPTTSPSQLQPLGPATIAAPLSDAFALVPTPYPSTGRQITPSRVTNAKSSSSRSQLVGAIIGSVTIIFVSLVILVFVWKPRRKRDDALEHSSSSSSTEDGAKQYSKKRKQNVHQQRLRTPVPPGSRMSASTLTSNRTTNSRMPYYNTTSFMDLVEEATTDNQPNDQSNSRDFRLGRVLSLLDSSVSDDVSSSTRTKSPTLSTGGGGAGQNDLENVSKVSRAATGTGTNQRRPKQQQQQQQRRENLDNRMPDINPLRMLESFDETSIYTPSSFVDVDSNELNNINNNNITKVGASPSENTTGTLRTDATTVTNTSLSASTHDTTSNNSNVRTNMFTAEVVETLTGRSIVNLLRRPTPATAAMVEQQREDESDKDIATVADMNGSFFDYDETQTFATAEDDSSTTVNINTFTNMDFDLLSDAYFNPTTNTAPTTPLKAKQFSMNNKNEEEMINFDPFRGVDLSDEMTFKMNSPTQVDISPLKDDHSTTATDFLLPKTTSMTLSTDNDEENRNITEWNSTSNHDKNNINTSFDMFWNSDNDADEKNKTSTTEDNTATAIDNQSSNMNLRRNILQEMDDISIARATKTKADVTDANEINQDSIVGMKDDIDTTSKELSSKNGRLQSFFFRSNKNSSSSSGKSIDITSGSRTVAYGGSGEVVVSTARRISTSSARAGNNFRIPSPTTMLKGNHMLQQRRYSNTGTVYSDGVAIDDKNASNNNNTVSDELSSSIGIRTIQRIGSTGGDSRRSQSSAPPRLVYSPATSSSLGVTAGRTRVTKTPAIVTVAAAPAAAPGSEVGSIMTLNSSSIYTVVTAPALVTADSNEIEDTEQQHQQHQPKRLVSSTSSIFSSLRQKKQRRQLHSTTTNNGSTRIDRDSDCSTSDNNNNNKGIDDDMIVDHHDLEVSSSSSSSVKY